MNWNNTEKNLRLAVLAGPLWYFAAVAWLTLSRFTYPFELEWMEGGSLLHLLRLQAGQPLYVAPSLEFTPYIYPPFYYYVSLGLSKLTGLDWFTPLRLASLLASLGCALLIFFLVRQQTSSAYWGWLAAGLFAATFRAGGAWFDIARVDMLFTCLMLAAVYALTALPNRLAEILSGLLFALAFYTKQTSLALTILMLAALLPLRGWRAALRLGLGFALLAGALTFVENSRSGGWYGYYIFHLPRFHRFVEPFWGQLLVQVINLVQPAAIALTLGLAGTLLPLRNGWKSDASLPLLASLGLTALSLAAGLNQGSYANVYVPAFAGFSILFGMGGPAFFKLLHQPHQRLIGYTLITLQFALLAFNPIAQLPTRADAAAGEKLVTLLRETPGEVLVPYHSYLAVRAGKPAYAHHIALLEIRGAFGGATDSEWAAIENEIETSIREKRFALIMLEHRHAIWQPIFDAYQPAPLDYPDPRAFLPVTGAQTRPETIWRP